MRVAARAIESIRRGDRRLVPGGRDCDGRAPRSSFPCKARDARRTAGAGVSSLHDARLQTTTNPDPAGAQTGNCDAILDARDPGSPHARHRTQRHRDACRTEPTATTAAAAASPRRALCGAAATTRAAILLAQASVARRGASHSRRGLPRRVHPASSGGGQACRVIQRAIRRCAQKWGLRVRVAVEASGRAAASPRRRYRPHALWKPPAAYVLLATH